MKLREVTRFDIVEMAWKALPSAEEGGVIVVVDVRNGNIEVLSKTREFEDWAKDAFDYKQSILYLKKEVAKLDVGTVYKEYRHEVCCGLLDLMEKYPHLI